MFRIEYDESSFTAEASGIVAGKIELRFSDDAAFPEKGWWDFPFIIAEWWLRAATEASPTAEVVLRFMDGPAACFFAGEEMLNIACYCDDILDSTIDALKVRIPRTELVDVLHKHAAHLIDVARKKGLNSRDVAQLDELLKNYQALGSSLRHRA